LKLVRLVLLAVAVALLPGSLRAQQYARWEAGAGVVSETASPVLFDFNGPGYIGARHLFGGPEGRFDWNLSPSLAIEGNVGYLTGFQTSYMGDNGHELLALGGIKAGWRGRHFGIYGKAEPGISSWTPGLWNGLGPAPEYEKIYHRRTDFTMDLGAALEAYPTPRTIVRLDLGTTLIAEYDQVLLREYSPTGYLELEEIAPGNIAQHLAMGLSIAHRFGEVRDEREREPKRQPLDLGVLYSIDQRVHTSNGQILPNRGGGAWMSWNFNRYISLDSTAFYSPQDDKFDFPQDGGRDLMAVWGIKAGLRRDRLGYFVALRPGMMQFSRTNDYQNYAVVPVALRWEKTTDYVSNVSGVVEYYAGRHLELRADVGNAYIHYHAANLYYQIGKRPTFTPEDAYYPPIQRASIVTLFGVGWRF
jgi:hypothetical protein